MFSRTFLIKLFNCNKYFKYFFFVVKINKSHLLFNVYLTNDICFVIKYRHTQSEGKLLRKYIKRRPKEGNTINYLSSWEEGQSVCEMGFNHRMWIAVLVSLALVTILEAKPSPYSDLDTTVQDLKVSVVDPLVAQISSLYEDFVETLKCSYQQIAKNLYKFMGIFDDSSEHLDNLIKNFMDCIPPSLKK